MVSPSGLNATERTSAVWPVRVAVLRPVATSHTISVPPLTRVLPSGLNATESTARVEALSVAVVLSVAMLHSRTVPS